MDNPHAQCLSHQNGVDAIFDSMELQEVPENEIESLENHLSVRMCKNIKKEHTFVHNSDSKLAQLMSQDSLKDFRAVLFPEDSSPDLRNIGQEALTSATRSRIEMLDGCADISSDTVSSIIEKVCQEVNGNFESKSDKNEVGVSQQASSEKCFQFHLSQLNHHGDKDVYQQVTSKRPGYDLKSKPLNCEVCNKMLASSEYFKNHMRSHTDERPFKCALCDKTFRQPSNLHAHMRIHTNEKPFKCKVCDKAFSQSGNMHIHMGIHMDKKKCQCPTCGKFFSQNGSLRNHMKIHSGERPHVCSECGRDFVRKSHLDAHMRTHTGERPFICSFCSRAFSQSGDLQSHMRLHTGDLPHICVECGKGYSAKSHLTKHMRIHSPERPFECSICGKSYNAKSTLVSHMRLHTGDRPYSCSWCEKRFYSSSHLKKHVKVHHHAYFMNTEERKSVVPPMLLKSPNSNPAEVMVSGSAWDRKSPHAHSITTASVNGLQNGQS